MLILGELDSLICSDHPEADKETGAVHCCGHHAQCAALLGIAKALKDPESKIFAITPIWRKDMNEERIFGDFAKVEENIRNAVNNMKNITVISGFDFVPQNEKYFVDLRLHTNDKGFKYYFKTLYDKIKLTV